MLNINNVPWGKILAEDVRSQIEKSEMSENLYYEFKEDEETPNKLVKEISAFANTYGGYIFIGVDDKKNITGCNKWNENRIHTTIHDSISPIPVFDVKSFSINERDVIVIRVEEGSNPPYVINDGRVYERVSSGSYPIKDSAKFSELYKKRLDFYDCVSKTIELPPIDIHSKRFPENVCACIDVGGYIRCREQRFLHSVFIDNIKMQEIAEIISQYKMEFSITRIGKRILVVLNKQTARDDENKPVDLDGGVQNFIEIMNDGSFRYRIVLATDRNSDKTSITVIGFLVTLYEKIYRALVGDHFSDSFLYAEKCEKLTVFKQFTPYYYMDGNNKKEIVEAYKRVVDRQNQIFGGNHISMGNRFPTTGYLHYDHAVFDEYNIKWNTDSLIEELLMTVYINLGFVDFPEWE